MHYVEYYIPNTNYHLGSITYTHNSGHHDFSILKTRKENVSLNSKRQAFALAGRLLYFNPDLKHFSTLTFAKPTKSYHKAYSCFKNFVYEERLNNPNFKYIAVPELHVSGNIHFHLISNKIQKNKKGAEHNVKNWKKGWSTSWTISQMTYYHRKHSKNKNNFEPLKYLFNYMKKTNNKIGGRWLLKSSNLNRPIKRECELDFIQVISTIQWLLNHSYVVNTKPISIANPQGIRIQLPIYSFYKKTACDFGASKRQGKPPARNGKTVPIEASFHSVRRRTFDFLFNISNNKKIKLNNKYKYGKQCISRSDFRHFKKG